LLRFKDEQEDKEDNEGEAETVDGLLLLSLLSSSLLLQSELGREERGDEVNETRGDKDINVESSPLLLFLHFPFLLLLSFLEWSGKRFWVEVTEQEEEEEGEEREDEE
jgi:hypothetical protein